MNKAVLEGLLFVVGEEGLTLSQIGEVLELEEEACKDLVMELKDKYTIVMVTHNMQQAVRVSDYTAFFLLGELVEFGKTDDIFSQPQDKRTEDYITGRFG